MDSKEEYYIGVDVGTNSARAALVTAKGYIVRVATHPIQVHQPQENFYEQSSEDVWKACCEVVKSIVPEIPKQSVCGIAFDATCSLVVCSDDFSPVSICPTGNEQWDIIMWMDHRANEQASRINATKNEVLDFVGGKISLEMQIPKLLWLKENFKTRWSKMAHFFDLPDFLTWKATGSLSRSLCSLVCKWTYMCNETQQGWNEDFLSSVGLDDIVKNNCKQIGSLVLTPGCPCGTGLTLRASQELGLQPGLPVATSIIDAHAGGLGSLCCNVGEVHVDMENILSVISGTSACFMAINKKPLFVPGVWGPYYSAMVPGLWLSEGGQSAAGKLIDYVIENHVAYPNITKLASEKNQHLQDVLNDMLKTMSENMPENYKYSGCSVTPLTTQYHVYPDYHGNRSPLADQNITGMVCGLNLSSGAEQLALHYLATVQALAYSTKQIIDTMCANEHDIKALHLCGGLRKNKLYVQTLADVIGLPVVLPAVEHSVLLGVATLAAMASKKFSSIQDAMSQMGANGQVVWPQTQHTQFHQKKYKVFLEMIDDQQKYRQIMK